MLMRLSPARLPGDRPTGPYVQTEAAWHEMMRRRGGGMPSRTQTVKRPVFDVAAEFQNGGRTECVTPCC